MRLISVTVAAFTGATAVYSATYLTPMTASTRSITCASAISVAIWSGRFSHPISGLLSLHQRHHHLRHLLTRARERVVPVRGLPRELAAQHHERERQVEPLGQVVAKLAEQHRRCVLREVLAQRRPEHEAEVLARYVRRRRSE